MSSQYTENLTSIWNTLRESIQKELGHNVVKSWIDPLKIEKITDNVMYLSAPSSFLRDWVNNNYVSQILKLCRKIDSNITSIEINISKQSANEIKNDDIKASSNLGFLKQEKTQTEEIGIPLDPRLNFDNFVVGKPNEFAYAAAKRVSDTDVVAFNPLFLYGSVGLGKTHLMNAIAWSIKTRNPSKNIVYLSAEKFMHQFIKAVRFRDTMAFKEQFRSVDVLMIDDIQFICGKESTQEEFFHTFNTLVDNKRQVIVSADKSPSDLDGLEERLKSRLGWGLVADIYPTNYELRLGILQTKVATMSTKIPDDVIEFIAHRITSNVRELEGALNRIVANAVFVGRAITIDSAKDVLSDLLRTNEQRLTIDQIKKKVSEHYLIKVFDLSSAKRSRKIALPRQVAMYLSKKLTTNSLPEIGRNFGDRDHTTVMHAVKKITKDIKSDASLEEDVRLLTHVLEKRS